MDASLDDVHAVIVHAHGATWSGNLVARLAERGAPIVFCASNHSPVAVTLPLEGHHPQNARMQAQLAASRPLAKQLWRQIVSVKILIQDHSRPRLALQGRKPFHSWPGESLPATRKNLEAQAARRYWPLLMGPDFRRDPDAGGVNGLLNYGYALMRATCARAVVAAGLHPTIDVQHSNRGNAFALADDLVEPFRPLVDALAQNMARDGVEALDRPMKRRFARLIAFDLTIAGEVSPVSIAAMRLAQSLARSFETGRRRLRDEPVFRLCAVCNGNDAYESYLRRIEASLPEKGDVHVLTLHRPAG